MAFFVVLAFSLPMVNAEDPTPPVVPFGDCCDTCQPCSGSYNVCQSQLSDFMDDLCQNCGPGTHITVLVWTWC